MMLADTSSSFCKAATARRRRSVLSLWLDGAQRHERPAVVCSQCLAPTMLIISWPSLPNHSCVNQTFYHLRIPWILFGGNTHWCSPTCMALCSNPIQEVYLRHYRWIRLSYSRPHMIASASDTIEKQDDKLALNNHHEVTRESPTTGPCHTVLAAVCDTTHISHAFSISICTAICPGKFPPMDDQSRVWRFVWHFNMETRNLAAAEIQVPIELNDAVYRFITYIVFAHWLFFYRRNVQIIVDM